MAEVIDISIEHNPSPKDVIVDFESSHSSVAIVNPDANAKSGQAADAKATYEALNTKANREDIPSVDLSGYAKKTDVNTSLSKKADKSELESYAKTSYVDDKLDEKQDALTAGANITILNGVISATGGGGSSIELSKPSADGAGKAADARETYLALEKKLDNGTDTNVVIGQSASSDPDKGNVIIGAVATGSEEGRGVAVGYGATITDGEGVVAIGANVNAGGGNPIVIGSRGDSRIIVYNDGAMTVGGKAVAMQETVETALNNKVDESEFNDDLDEVAESINKVDNDLSELSLATGRELANVKATIASNANSVNAALRLKQSKLKAGANITIMGDVISASGSISGITTLLANEDKTKRVNAELVAESDLGEIPVIGVEQYNINQGSFSPRNLSLRITPSIEQFEGILLYDLHFDVQYHTNADGDVTVEDAIVTPESEPIQLRAYDNSDGITLDIDSLVSRLDGKELEQAGTIAASKNSDNSISIHYQFSGAGYGDFEVIFNVLDETEKITRRDKIISDLNFTNFIGYKVKYIPRKEEDDYPVSESNVLRIRRPEKNIIYFGYDEYSILRFFVFGLTEENDGWTELTNGDDDIDLTEYAKTAEVLPRYRFVEADVELIGDGEEVSYERVYLEPFKINYFKWENKNVSVSTDIRIDPNNESVSRDMVLVVDAIDDGKNNDIVWVDNNGVTFFPRGGDAANLEVVAGKRNVFFITEVQSDVFMVARDELALPNEGGGE